MSKATSLSTPQEDFWAGQFGDEYIERNHSDALLASNIALFSKILRHTGRIESVIEFGANVGMNLKAIRSLLPSVAGAAVEINSAAANRLRQNPGLEVYNQSFLEFDGKQNYDLTLSKGVLIHIHPDYLPTAYSVLYRYSNRYICIAEYYNPTPVRLTYRGHTDRLFKRDFAGEMLDRFSDLRLVDYGFAYHRGPFPQDDITWFLLAKPQDAH